MPGVQGQPEVRDRRGVRHHQGEGGRGCREVRRQGVLQREGDARERHRARRLQHGTRGEENGGDHFTPTMELLEAGIPVLGEKPISNRIEEGEQMVALAAKKNVPYAINLNHRFTPAALRAKEWVDAGPAGQLAHDQHAHVDQQPGRDLALVPPARAAPALLRRHALLLRRREERGRLHGEGRGPEDAGRTPRCCCTSRAAWSAT